MVYIYFFFFAQVTRLQKQRFTLRVIGEFRWHTACFNTVQHIQRPGRGKRRARDLAFRPSENVINVISQRRVIQNDRYILDVL